MAAHDAQGGAAAIADAPIPCFVSGNKGYVWDATGAMRLRKQHRIMGSLSGSVAQFKNQNEVNHLPLELSADEVTLAAQQGWITLLPETSAPLRAAAAVAAAAWEQRTGERRRAGSGGGGGVRDPGPDWHDAYHAYYTQHHPQSGFTGSYLPLIGGKRRHLSNSQAHGQAQREQQVPGQQGAGVVGEKEAAGGGQGVGGAGGAGRGREVDVSERGWRAAVAEGEAYTVPLTAEEAAAARAGAGGQQQRQQQQATGPQRHRGGTEAAGQGGAALWRYPSTPEEQLRYDVFCDLHRQGYMMTGGIKFGADLMAYPGDPSLYHAQFCVRPVPSGASCSSGSTDRGASQGAGPGADPRGAALNPMVLKAVARGAHAARKHLMLAFYDPEDNVVQGAAGGVRAEGGVQEGQQQRPRPRIRYLSFAPESGFGSA